MSIGAIASAPIGAADPENPARATVLTPDELAERWQIKKKTLWRLSKEGKVPSIRLGKFYRYPLLQIEGFEAGSGTAADAQSGVLPGAQPFAGAVSRAVSR